MHLLTAGFEQNINEYQSPEQSAAIGFLQALNKKTKLSRLMPPWTSSILHVFVQSRLPQCSLQGKSATY